ncbi:MAG: glycosyl hydrolase, partial [Polyangia bacterium]
SGGAAAAAGSIALGGSAVIGGNTSTGGAKTSGGATSPGGVTTSGGSSETGGTKTSGGATATGGAKTSGATSAGGTTSAGGATSNGGSPCNVSPVTPNASQQVKNALCYLYQQYGNHVLSGQQEANWNDNPTDVSWYATQGMKTPAILGTDFAYHSSAGCTGVNISTTHAIAHWNAGGLVMYRYHQGMPVSGTTCMNDCYTGTNCSESTPPSGFFTNVITAGTAENTAFNARLDYMTVQFKAMAAVNMPVILALFHETQSNGWFWWSKGTGAEFIALWKYAFNYLTTTKGNNNIIWLMPYSGSPTSAYWPGPTMVDISGGDTYGSNQPFTSLYSSCKGIMGSTMPIALHETGLIPTPSAMFPTAAPWILFNIWAGYETSNNTVANIKAVYSDSHTITRDLIPSLK